MNMSGNTQPVEAAQDVILTPVFRDWQAARLLLDALDTSLSAAGIRARILLVDDGSPEPAPQTWDLRELSSISRVDVLVLRRNLGHQRAIAVGLAYVEAHFNCERLVVMDCDGEDDPRDVSKLMAAVRQEGVERVVFAGRRKRSEGVVFRTFYFLYRVLFRALTGQSIRVGNFSAMSHSLLNRVVAVSEIWTHYASGLRRSRLPCVEVETTRAHRLSGTSSMNFVGLVTHGLSAIAVYSDVVGTRLLLCSLVLGVGVVALIAVVIGLKFLTLLAIPGWATTAAGLLLLLLTQAGAFSVFFAFVVLSSRNVYSFVPCRDYAHFVLSFSGIGQQDQ